MQNQLDSTTTHPGTLAVSEFSPGGTRPTDGSAAVLVFCVIVSAIAAAWRVSAIIRDARAAREARGA